MTMNWDLVGDKHYNKLMLIANDDKLMDVFYNMLEDHLEKHLENNIGSDKQENCYFCLLILNW